MIWRQKQTKQKRKVFLRAIKTSDYQLTIKRVHCHGAIKRNKCEHHTYLLWLCCIHHEMFSWEIQKCKDCAVVKTDTNLTELYEWTLCFFSDVKLCAVCLSVSDIWIYINKAVSLLTIVQLDSWLFLRCEFFLTNYVFQVILKFVKREAHFTLIYNK